MPSQPPGSIFSPSFDRAAWLNQAAACREARGRLGRTFPFSKECLSGSTKGRNLVGEGDMKAAKGPSTDFP
jgi:hypothetical protein